MLTSKCVVDEQMLMHPISVAMTVRLAYVHLQFYCIATQYVLGDDVMAPCIFLCTHWSVRCGYSHHVSRSA